MNTLNYWYSRISRELFSFIGLGISLIALFINTSVNPSYYMTIQDAEGIAIQTTAINPMFIVTIGLILLVIYFLIRIFRKK